jgi:hypothetical protein
MVHLAIFSCAIGVNPATAVLSQEVRDRHGAGPCAESREAKHDVLEAFISYHEDHFDQFAKAFKEHFMAKSRVLGNMPRMDRTKGRGYQEKEEEEERDTSDAGGSAAEKNKDDEQIESRGKEGMDMEEDGSDAGEQVADLFSSEGEGGGSEGGEGGGRDAPPGGGGKPRFEDSDDESRQKSGWGAIFGCESFDKAKGQDICDALVEWKDSPKFQKMRKSLKDVMNADDLMDVIDGGLAKGTHWPKAGELLWDWAPTVVKASKLPLVVERNRQGLDAGLGLFAVKKIEPMQLVAILSDGPVYEDREDPAIKDKEVVLVRKKAFKFGALYQGAALDDLEAGAKNNYAGWMANSPAEGSECNCVCLSQCAGENRLWFSFLISVKAIKAKEEILSNALPYDKEWETF